MRPDLPPEPSGAGRQNPYHVVILSCRSSNLVPCVHSVLAREPGLPPENIIVVDDGARAEAEPQLPKVTWIAGEQPFVFARNANLGIAAAGGDVILMNDDTRLLTNQGFTRLARAMTAHPRVGICSAGIRGVVGNRNQRARALPPFRLEARALAFVCVYIRGRVYDHLGPLDTSFTGYGFDDDDYCLRARAAGYGLAVWSRCEVDHSGALASSFRTRVDVNTLLEENRRRYEEKWPPRREATSRPRPFPAPRAETPGEWIPIGNGVRVENGRRIFLSASNGIEQEQGLVSRWDYNDVELEFGLRLSPEAKFIARLHHQNPDDPRSNSYHLVSTPLSTYIARHDAVLETVRARRSGLHRILFRWQDQHLEVRIDGVRLAFVVDNLLQSGYCGLAISSGEAQLLDINLRDLSGRDPAPSIRRCQDAEPLPFTATPRRNLIYHIWPVRGSMWRWNLEQLKARIDLFNGRRLIGIVYDARSEHPDVVKSCLEGHGCEFVIAPNSPMGEVVNFPAMLQQVRSTDPNEVTFYGHAKGVRHEPAVPSTVQRWADVIYRANLDDWSGVRRNLERFALTGAFRMVGRFRAHHYAGDWHYSGTYFWMRHARVFTRANLGVPQFYGGVEAWPGVHFGREETGCLLYDQLRLLPYHPQFWHSMESEVARWDQHRTLFQPPPDLLDPHAFEGHAWPRLEQRPDEFAWFLERLVELRPRTLLTIGARHGGVEWHVARVFRSLGLDIRITAVELAPAPSLAQTLDHIRSQFGQQIEVVGGDSTGAAVRARLSSPYDAVFIDGDHSYRSSRSDFELARSQGAKLVALHDIVDSDWHAEARCCVSRLWAGLRSQYHTEERAGGDWGGIGIVRLD